MKIAVTDAEAQASAEAQADLAHLEDLVGSLPSPQELKDIKISPLDFEKVSSTQTYSTAGSRTIPHQIRINLSPTITHQDHNR